MPRVSEKQNTEFETCLRTAPIRYPERLLGRSNCGLRYKIPKRHKGNDTDLVIVDRLPLTGIFVPTRKDTKAGEAYLLSQDALPEFQKSLFPTKILIFKSNYWSGLAEITNVKLYFILQFVSLPLTHYNI